VTLDDDFGDWAVLPLDKHPGVIRMKTHPPTTANITEILVPLLEEKDQNVFENRLVIVSPRNIRWIRTAS
jgi:predicted nuclease of predicted toxin-antitoxin system